LVRQGVQVARGARTHHVRVQVHHGSLVRLREYPPRVLIGRAEVARDTGQVRVEDGDRPPYRTAGRLGEDRIQRGLEAVRGAGQARIVARPPALEIPVRVRAHQA